MLTKRWLLALGGGVLLGMATPPTDALPGVLAGMMLLALAVRGAKSAARGFGLGVLWATAAGLIGMRFVPSVIQLFTDLGTPLALLSHLLLSAAQSLHWAFGMAIAVALMRRWKVPLELAFASGVFVALMMPSVFLWSFASVLSPWTALVQSAEYIGERGTSVLLSLVVTLSIRAAATWSTPRAALKPAVAALGLVALMVAHGSCAMDRWRNEPGDQVRVGLIHAGIDPKYRWEKKNHPAILRLLQAQTRRAEAQGAELSVWPEAAYPYVLAHDLKFEPRGQYQVRAAGVRGPILFGLITAEQPRQQPDGSYYQDQYNSATLLTRDGKLQNSYDKMQLLWFGETIPGGETFPWLKRTFQRSGGLIPGTEVRGLTLPRQPEPLRMGILNCYEDTLPDVGRAVFEETNPNLLVNVTNDAWFVGTAEPELHIRLSVMRSIELRRDMVRAVNHGVAGWIDASGTIRARNDSPEPHALLVTPTVRSAPPTLYARFGDWPMALLLSVSAGAAAYRRRRG